MLLDEVDIIVTTGHGGAGKASFYPGKKAGPDGGDGGKGGDVYIEAISDIFALNQFSKSQKVKSEDGGMGGKKLKTGADGEDLIIKLPIGSELLNKDNSEIVILENTGVKILIAKGGIGGRGNGRLANSRSTTPLEPNLGVLNKKVIADIPGLIEGAADGKGLGHKFLKHIEKVKLLLHCISSESENSIKDYEIIREELKKFNPELLNK